MTAAPVAPPLRRGALFAKEQFEAAGPLLFDHAKRPGSLNNAEKHICNGGLAGAAAAGSEGAAPRDVHAPPLQLLL